MKKTSIIFLACTALCGCKEVLPVEPAIPSSDNISLVIDGKTILDFNPDLHQLGYNASKREFRVSDDSFGKYFVLRCDRMPAVEGDKISGELIFTDSKKDVNHCDTDFTVTGVDDGNGRLIHLWDQDKKIMATVKELN